MNGLRTYTVFGLGDNNSGELTVAAVLAGDHFPVDSPSEWPDEAQRWATTVEARNPAHAEALACSEFEDSRSEEDR